MYDPLSFCLILLFLFSLINHIPCASSKDGLAWCEPIQFQCGNVTAGFPFWGGNRPDTCGYKSLELHCDDKNITSLYISNHEYNVFDFNHTSNTLRLVRADLLGSFCSTTFSSEILPPGISEILPTYKKLTIFHHCDTKFHYVSSYTCPGRGVISAHNNPIYPKYCHKNFTVTVPASFFPEENKLNMNDLESVLRKGFEVIVNTNEITCEECSSSTYEHYDRCSGPFHCGNQDRLFYPFWVRGREDCGHPDFKLDCSKGFAVFNLTSVKYRILEANYNTRIIKIARLDYCPTFSRDKPFAESFHSFPENILPLAPHTEMLTIYYGCQIQDNMSSLTNVTIGGLHCAGDKNATRNYVIRNLSSHLDDNFKNICGRNDSIRASTTALNTLRSDNLTKTLEQGFEVELSQDCSECLKSKGACGYNQTSKRFVCYCNDGPYDNNCGSPKRIHGTWIKPIGIFSGSVAGIVLLLLLLTLFLRFLRIRRRRLRYQNLKALIPLEHYSYAQVKRITKSFVEVVGRGGFGIVYRGTLSDGRMVAVKVLSDSKDNGEDFINEVASMSRTSHLNIVSLLGFCSEGSKRAIIYEFLENGSLDKFISGKTSVNLDWMALYRIALGVARGVEYLHHGCKTRIVHFDIKPQNVLLDESFCPKVSDFGLAKLCEKKESNLSLLDTRGTVGYIAPEMISRVYGNVSHKSDVYSYGMLVLDMIGARNKEKANQASTSNFNTSSIYFPEWLYRDLELGSSGRHIENEIYSKDDELVKKMTLVSLWCIQPSPSDRQAMNRVVEMMEGSLDALEVPPKPVFQIPGVLQESSIYSQDTSNYTEG